jgi:hypothetical protein
MVIRLITSELSLNGSDAKRHAPGVPVTGARRLRRGQHCREEHDAFREGPCFMC